jgi:NTE family protein
MPDRKRLALVIGSGGVKCAAALGLQRVLEREGIGLDLLVGCSAGGLFAATMALGWESRATIELTQRLWTREATSRRRLRSVLSMFLPGLMGFDAQFGVLDDRVMLERLRTAFADRRIEEARLPLRLAATDFSNGEQVVLADGPLVDALRACLALPYMFAPWRVNGRLLADGFLSDALPVGVAVREGAGVMLALGFEGNYQRQIDSLPRFAFQVTSILSNNLQRANGALYAQNGAAAVIPLYQEFGRRIGVFEVEQLGTAIAAGERAMEAALPRLRAALEE